MKTSHSSPSKASARDRASARSQIAAGQGNHLVIRGKMPDQRGTHPAGGPCHRDPHRLRAGLARAVLPPRRCSSVPRSPHRGCAGFSGARRTCCADLSPDPSRRRRRTAATPRCPPHRGDSHAPPCTAVHQIAQQQTRRRAQKCGCGQGAGFNPCRSRIAIFVSHG